MILRCRVKSAEGESIKKIVDELNEYKSNKPTISKLNIKHSTNEINVDIVVDSDELNESSIEDEVYDILCKTPEANNGVITHRYSSKKFRKEILEEENLENLLIVKNAEKLIKEKNDGKKIINEEEEEEWFEEDIGEESVIAKTLDEKIKEKKYEKCCLIV